MRAVELVRRDEPVSKTAADLGIMHTFLYNRQWAKQDRIDRGEMLGKTTAESGELRFARRWIQERGDEVQVLRWANTMLWTEARLEKG